MLQIEQGTDAKYTICHSFDCQLVDCIKNSKEYSELHEFLERFQR